MTIEEKQARLAELEKELRKFSNHRNLPLCRR